MLRWSAYPAKALPLPVGSAPETSTAGFDEGALELEFLADGQAQIAGRRRAARAHGHVVESRAWGQRIEEPLLDNRIAFKYGKRRGDRHLMLHQRLNRLAHRLAGDLKLLKGLRLVSGADIGLLARNEVGVRDQAVFEIVDLQSCSLPKSNGAQVAGQREPPLVRGLNSGSQGRARDVHIGFERVCALRRPVLDKGRASSGVSTSVICGVNIPFPSRYPAVISSLGPGMRPASINFRMLMSVCGSSVPAVRAVVTPLARYKRGKLNPCSV